MSKKEYIELKKKIAKEERAKLFKAIILIILVIVLINCLSASNANAMQDDILKNELKTENGLWTKEAWMKYQAIQK